MPAHKTIQIFLLIVSKRLLGIFWKRGRREGESASMTPKHKECFGGGRGVVLVTIIIIKKKKK